MPSTSLQTLIDQLEALATRLWDRAPSGSLEEELGFDVLNRVARYAAQLEVDDD